MQDAREDLMKKVRTELLLETRNCNGGDDLTKFREARCAGDG